MAFVDSDAAIEEAAGMTVADLFEVYGEAEFRQLERRVIARLLTLEPCVVALGGGAFVDAETRCRVLDNALVLWLHADLDILVERTARKPGKRPLLAGGDPREVLDDLMRRREPYYEQAHCKIVTGSEPIAHVVARIRTQLADLESADGR